ncbi:MAG: hypothetical protein AABY22_08430 [Nanoarchaeota archaeon]
MNVKEFINKLLEEGLTDEEVVEALKKGDPKNGIKPVDPRFAKLNFKRIKKSLDK